MDEVLSRRALNRATLARQLLLERAALTPLATVRAPRRHAGAGAAQPLHRALVAARGLPARVVVGAARAPRGRARRRHARDDPPRHRRRLSAVAPARAARLRGPAAAAPGARARAARRRPRACCRARADGPGGAAADRDRAAARSSRSGSRTSTPAALAHACQMRLAFVQVPPRGLWGRSAQVRSTTRRVVARPAVRRRAPRSTRSCCATSPRSARRRSRT